MPTTSDLHPDFRTIADAAIAAADAFAKEHGYRVRITQGMRSVAAQDRLYAKGRTEPGRIVTYVRGGYSWHNYGLAFDIGVFTPNFTQYIGNGDMYDKIGAYLKEDSRFRDLVWGGDFPSIFGGTFRDRPHYEYHPGYDTRAGAASVIRWKDEPFSVPLSPSSLSEADAAFKEMLDRGVYSSYTQRRTPVDTDMLAIFLSRYHKNTHA